MSKNSVRAEIVCLNCEHPNVMERFCPGCGQENIETHQSFNQLAFHFVEDLTHYEGNFWKTIRFLLFHPAKLTKVYLSGKRKKFVPPVKLYIFISFLTFFLVAVLPDISDSEFNGPMVQRKVADSDVAKNAKAPVIFHSDKYASVAEFDSVQRSLPENKQLGFINSYFSRKMIASLERNTNRQLYDKMDGVMFQNMPKALFIYLPIFGFFLWLFHSKKRWYFFDHAIFTLHYFSFLLLILSISISGLERMYSLANETLRDTLSNITGFATCIWILAYFYIGQKRMYRQSWTVTIVKSTALLFINLIFMLFLVLLLLWYSFVNI